MGNIMVDNTDQTLNSLIINTTQYNLNNISNYWTKQSEDKCYVDIPVVFVTSKILDLQFKIWNFENNKWFCSAIFNNSQSKIINLFHSGKHTQSFNGVTTYFKEEAGFH